MYIAKKTIADRHEIFINETVKDINNKDVIVPRSLGLCDLKELESEKKYFEGLIEEINNKINSIKLCQ